MVYSRRYLTINLRLMSKKLIGCAAALAFSAALIAPIAASAAHLPPNINQVTAAQMQAQAQMQQAQMQAHQMQAQAQMQQAQMQHVQQMQQAQAQQMQQAHMQAQAQAQMQAQMQQVHMQIQQARMRQAQMPILCQFPGQMPVPCVVIFHPRG